MDRLLFCKTTFYLNKEYCHLLISRDLEGHDLVTPYKYIYIYIPYKNIYEIFTVSQLMLQVLSVICFSCSVMDIKELKFLDIGPTVTKPGCEQGASTETGCVPSGGHNQTSRVPHPPETSSVSHFSTVPITILRRGGYISDQC